MKVKHAIPAMMLLVVVLIAFVIPVAGACDPTKEDCSVTPTATRSVTPSALAASVPSTSTVRTDSVVSGNAIIAASSLDNSLPLTCLLPDNEMSSNALGVADICPVMPVHVRAVKVIPTPAPTKVAAVVQPKGDSPQTAMLITDNLQTIDAGGMQWFKIDNGNNFFLDVWLDASGRSGITFALYAPDQFNDLNVDTPPKGRGSPVKADPSHDQWWKGSYATGVWYILVRNYNLSPVQYKIGTKQSTTERNCISYWEWLPTGQHVLWTDCGMYSGSK